MFMFMNLLFMRRMFMLVGAVFSRVIVIMHVRIGDMMVFMGMFVKVFVRVYMAMLMKVADFPMPVLMAVDMGVFMGMQMLMLVFSFHGGLLERYRIFSKYKEDIFAGQISNTLPTQPLTAVLG